MSDKPTPIRPDRPATDEELEELVAGAGDGAPDPDYKPRDLTARPILAPARVAVILRCPGCNMTSTVEATLSARVVRDSDGAGFLVLRSRHAKVGHVCGQQSLGLAEGPRVR